MSASTILDANGQPFPARAASRSFAMQGSPSGLSPMGTLMGNPYVFPYDAANWQTQEMGDWLPWIRSPDAEINIFRDRMVARSRDLVRNDGWAIGGIIRILDNTVGTNLRLFAKPDYRALCQRFGIKAFDSEWAGEFQRAAEALWRGYSESLGHYNDVNRQLTIGQQMRLAMRHKLIDGDSLLVSYWMPERVGYGASDYATAFLLVDPDRLSNPFGMLDTKHLRGGVEIDDDGVPQAIHVRRAEQNDWYNAIEANTWERIECEDEDGWRRVILDFERDRAGQHRGVGIFTPVLARFKMLARYYGVELQAAAVASSFGTYVVSPYDPALVGDALAGDDELSRYQQLRADFHQERPAMLDGVRVPTLAPGEKIESVAAAHPHNDFSDFAHEMLRTFAAAAGISAEQVTQDWSRTNYSSARAALMESWKTLTRRANEFKTNTATPMYAVWLREAMEQDELPLPAGAPAFAEAATAYARCGWLGPARGWIDPVKEKAGAVMGMDACLSTLMSEAAEQGNDWEEMLDQRAIEIRRLQELNIPLPDWIGAVSAGEAARAPEAPQPR